MDETTEKVVVAGGTGNVGSFIVGGFLERGAAVAVPSRSADKLAGLREHLAARVEPTDLERLHAVEGNVADEEEGPRVYSQIAEAMGTPDAVFASLGNLKLTDSLLTAGADEMQAVIDGYLIAHLLTARTFLTQLQTREATYVLINGPLAFEPGGRASLVSIATAGQHMLFESLARELEESPLRLLELVNYAFIRQKETQPSSEVSGDAVGAFCAQLVSGRVPAPHGESIHLRSMSQVDGAEATRR